MLGLGLVRVNPLLQVFLERWPILSSAFTIFQEVHQRRADNKTYRTRTGNKSEESQSYSDICSIALELGLYSLISVFGFVS